MILAVGIAAAVLSVAQSQSVGNGVSKSTYATSDPVPAKQFLEKYFPVDPCRSVHHARLVLTCAACAQVCTPGDECDNDICVCPAGTGGTTEWYIQQGRTWFTTYGSCSGGPKEGNGFGVHMVNLTNHLWTGGLSTETVEGYFKTKIAAAITSNKYDSFMDYNTMWFTSGGHSLD